MEPITSTLWKGLSVGVVHDVVAERWAAADLDFLELSIRFATGASEAATQQRALADEIRGAGLNSTTMTTARPNVS